MTIKSLVLEIMNYLPVKQQNETGKQALKKLVDVNLTGELRARFPSYEVKGHTQQGLWADVPWVGIHDKRIDSSPQTGIYFALLFSVDGSRVALSIQHGTENKGIHEITESVAKVAQQMTSVEGFSATKLKLRPDDSTMDSNSRPGKYEIANILGCQYSINDMPEMLETKICKLVAAYNVWAQDVMSQDQEENYQSVDAAIANHDMPGDYPPPDRLNRVLVKIGSQHPPRNPNEGAKALGKAEYQCEVDPDHTTFLTAKGKQYMEKHHLIPMENYFDFDKTIDHYNNIFSLCPNCHKKIHIAQEQDKRTLIELLFQKRAADLAAAYGVTLSDLMKFYKLHHQVEK